MNARLSRRICVIVVGLICLVSGGCAVAPLIQTADGGGPALIDELPAARAVEVGADDGVMLRGWHIAATPQDDPAHDAPRRLVLHLLPSGVSTTNGVPIGIGTLGLGPTIDTFSRAGYDSLIFDYRGLGNSEGTRLSDRLLQDGRRMWRAALELVDHQPERIILRAGSLGSLIVADLLAHLESSASEPGAVILYAPVRGETIVRNGARARGGLASLLGRLWYRAPCVDNLETVLAATTSPVLIFLAEDDAYLPAAERELLRASAIESGHTVHVQPGDHQTLILRSWGFTLDEATFSGRRTPELPNAERVFLEALPARRF